MRKTTIAVLGLAAMLGACRKRTEMAVSREDAPDIPREVAVQKLRELLPTAETVYCTAPKESYKASEIKDWGIQADGIRIVPVKEKDPALGVTWAEITQVRMDKWGRYFQVRLFAPAQADPAKDLLAFTWRAEEPPKRVVELIEALRLKK